MLFHVTPADHIRVMNEHEPADRNPGDSSFASEKELYEVASDWPMKRLVEIWTACRAYNQWPGSRIARPRFAASGELFSRKQKRLVRRRG